MRKNRVLVILAILCLVTLVTCVLFSCNKKETQEAFPAEGRVVPVSAAAETIYAAMLAADGSKDATYFTLTCNGEYKEGETAYTFDFKGAFTIAPVDCENDRRSQISFEIRQGVTEVFLLYYDDGKLYLHFPPYASRACISDFNLASSVREFSLQKRDGGTVAAASALLPSFASRVFTSCRQFLEDGVNRYVFTLSYSKFFEGLSSFVTNLNAGISPAEFFSALHLTEAKTAAFLEDTEATTVEFRVKDGLFLGASADRAEKSSFSVNDFSLVGVAASIALPSALSSFTEFDFRSFELEGTMNLSADYEKSDRAVNYDVTVDRDYGAVTYPFEYVFKSHYVAGQGLEFALSLTDMNGKASFFSVKGDYLFVDLSAYGVAKFKKKTADLWSDLETTGFCDTDAYDFKDKLRFLILLLGGRSEANDVVTYTLGADFFNLLSEKIGFRGLFGVSGATLSWSKADGIGNLSASLRVGGMQASLAAPTFRFGVTAAIPEPQGAEAYTDLSSRETTHFSIGGVITENTGAFSSSVSCLESLLSSLTLGTRVELPASDESVAYTAEVVYGATGALKNLFVRFTTANGRAEIVNLYYTEDTSDSFYLIYPEQSDGTRRYRACTFTSDRMKAFNAALGVSESNVGRKLLLGAKESSFMIGAQSPMAEAIADKLKLLYPDLDLSLLTDLIYRRVELKIGADRMEGKIVLDSQNDVVVTMTKFKVTFGDQWKLTGITFPEAESAAFNGAIGILDKNNMPTKATAQFSDGVSYLVSLKNFNDSSKTIWEYGDSNNPVPTRLAAAGEATVRKVPARVSLLGRTETKELSVDVSPVQSVTFDNSAKYPNRYFSNESARGYRFNLYTEEFTLEEFLATVTRLRVGQSSPMTVNWGKQSDWEQSGNNFIVTPKVKCYFDTEITLGASSVITLLIEGEKDLSIDRELLAADENFNFLAYEYNGRNPFDASVYPSALQVKTKSGENITAKRVEWFAEDVPGMALPQEYKNDGALYRYQTADREDPDTVVAHVFDVTGNFFVLDVPVYFEKKVVDTADFDVDGIDGVTYDAKKKTFTFDVLKIRELSAGTTDKVLPRVLTANKKTNEETNEETNKETAKEFVFRGGIWIVDETRSNVANASGQKGTLTLKIGDAICGYQDVTFSYEFTVATIEKIEFYGADKQKLGRQPAKTSLYEYSFTDLNVYTYRFPRYIRVTYADESVSDALPVSWRFDKPYSESDLMNGGAYTLTGAVGSETLTVKMNFVAAEIGEGYVTDRETTIPRAVKEGRECLIFSVFAALAGEGKTTDPIYSNVEDYPAMCRVTFNDAAKNPETDLALPVIWDISAYDAQTNMISVGGIYALRATPVIRSGYLEDENAYTAGQTFTIHSYVESAAGDDNLLYVNENKDVEYTIRLLERNDETGGIRVNDPRKVSTYGEYLYVPDAKGALYPIAVEWQGVENGFFVEIGNYYTQELAKDALVYEIGKTFHVWAKIGNESFGVTTKKITINVAPSRVENIKADGFPLAASTMMTGGVTPYAILQRAESGTIGEDFSYDFVMSINPYYVDPTAKESYPSKLTFDLDGKPVVCENEWLEWDYSSVPADAAKKKETVRYGVYAVVPLGNGFKIKVPAALEVAKKAIDKVYIDGSDQPYIDVYCYDENPFGGTVEGDEVTRKVTVQFVGDASEYELDMKYSKKGVVLSHTGAFYDVTIRVGNEAGGYQEKERYQIRVKSKTVGKIVATPDEGEPDVFYEFDTEKSTETFSSSDIYVRRSYPKTLTVTFLETGESETVYHKSAAEAAGKGLVFDWIQKAVDEETNSVGVIFWNPTLAEENAEKEASRQAIYNPNQKGYIEMTQADIGDFFDNDEIWSKKIVYRDAGDPIGENDLIKKSGVITAKDVLDLFDAHVKTSLIERAQQSRYLTTAAGVKKSEGDALDAGEYRLYVEISDKTCLYRGAVYHTVTIDKKDISASVELYVGIGRRPEETPKESYNPDPEQNYKLTAKSNTHPDVALLVDGLSEKLVKDVLYGPIYVDEILVGYQPTAYVLSVSVAENPNYTTEGKTLRFMVEEISLFEAGESYEGKVTVNIKWDSKEKNFVVKTLTVKGVNVLESLTDSYEIKYFENDEDFSKPIETFKEKQSYYYQLTVKRKNYEKWSYSLEGGTWVYSYSSE